MALGRDLLGASFARSGCRGARRSPPGLTLGPGALRAHQPGPACGVKQANAAAPGDLGAVVAGSDIGVRVPGGGGAIVTSGGRPALVRAGPVKLPIGTAVSRQDHDLRLEYQPAHPLRAAPCRSRRSQTRAHLRRGLAAFSPRLDFVMRHKPVRGGSSPPARISPQPRLKIRACHSPHQHISPMPIERHLREQRDGAQRRSSISVLARS